MFDSLEIHCQYTCHLYFHYYPSTHCALMFPAVCKVFILHFSFCFYYLMNSKKFYWEEIIIHLQRLLFCSDLQDVKIGWISILAKYLTWQVLLSLFMTAWKLLSRASKRSCWFCLSFLICCKSWNNKLKSFLFTLTPWQN